ncbi:predicted protein [Histoplasma mississippiense (nom. inval.)]|uniref:predicted protein n=1 Tax=Ajellomyces capsulatus (strain NAm1 / WU24) TaxID=2059318 RepID=UPI000157B808|nr:predicted protein [Histoplasma mississippiense (nom. inval.)]EDN03485.1 predicted protein [Histoplasma mississippiense (nom. inval.)]
MASSVNMIPGYTQSVFYGGERRMHNPVYCLTGNDSLQPLTVVLFKQLCPYPRGRAWIVGQIFSNLAWSPDNPKQLDIVTIDTNVGQISSDIKSKSADLNPEIVNPFLIQTS